WEEELPQSLTVAKCTLAPFDSLRSAWQTPKAHAGHVVVKNHYVGINATDVNITNGAYTKEPPPFGCGLDAVGEIVEVGEGVTDFQVHEAVCYRKLGAFAEYVEVDAMTLVKVPIPSPAVLPLVVCGTSASIALERVGHMKSNETVLMTAAAGGTGQFVVQLCDVFRQERIEHVLGELELPDIASCILACCVAWSVSN
ncbi:hypothetical protein Gpo141_00013954, partial [Globisporangium polare]